MNAAHADLGLLKRGCCACHNPDQSTYKAPSFKAIAARYADKSEEVRLAQSIVKGSAGQWSKAAMPPTPRVSPLEARKLVEWVLAFK
jgi:cytochrome c